jgi:hypothetical protein
LKENEYDDEELRLGFEKDLQLTDTMRKYTEFEEQLEEEKEQERKEREEWSKEIGLPYEEYLPNVYNVYKIKEKDLQDGKYIFIF